MYKRIETKGNIGVIDIVRNARTGNQYAIWVNLKERENIHKSQIYLTKRDELPYFNAEGKRIYLDDLDSSEYYEIKTKKKKRE